MSNPPKNRGISHVGDVLQSLLQNSKGALSEQFIRWRLWNAWPEVLGEEISRYTMPVSYHEGTVYIWVKNSARMQDLIFLVKPITEKINKYAHKCGWPEKSRPWARSVKFTLDRKTVPKLEESSEGLKEFLSKPFPSGDGEPPHDR